MFPSRALAFLALSALLAPFAVPPSSGSHAHFDDITQKAGIHFTHNNGAFGQKFLPETLGPGVAFIDYNNDGWQDIFFVNGTAWPGHPGRVTTPALYHNNHDGTFTDVTRKPDSPSPCTAWAWPSATTTMTATTTCL